VSATIYSTTPNPIILEIRGKIAMNIRKMTKEDAPLVHQFMKEKWGGEPLLIHGKKYYPSSGNLEGFLLFDDSKDIKGFLIYDTKGSEYEIIVFEVFDKFKGLGTKLLDEFIRVAKAAGHKKVIVMTTNDDLDALRFYQRRGFVITGIAINIFEQARKIKPRIPELGDYNIPIRDEILMERNII
jgi:ribosomal protein S18 acetylase RimI-like enzyme